MFNSDWRNIKNGHIISSLGYVDQPYLIKTDDHAWLCCLTVCNSREGDAGQHVETRRSFDKGLTWSKPVCIESDSKFENSYASMLKTAYGRIYIFYNHNSDNVREVKFHEGEEVFNRVDSLGHFVYKYSDDHGKNWSRQRYDIPFRLFKCDRDNVYAGKLCFFWNVGKPFIRHNTACVPLHKVGQMGKGFYQQSEGALLASDNLLSERNPALINWETLPDGDVGLRTPKGGGLVAEEQSYVVLSDGSICATYRSCDGYPVECYSRDGGHNWEVPRYKCFANGAKVKNPRSANFVWKCENGKYIYWFHNHGGRFIREMWENHVVDLSSVRNPYSDRNPAWLCGGTEIDGATGKIIQWGEPQIVLYDDNPMVRISYPDLIEDDGEYYISETQKSEARIHLIPKDFIDNIWEPKLGKKLYAVCDARKIKVPELPAFYLPDVNSSDFRGKSTNNRLLLRFKLANKQAGPWLTAFDRNSLGIMIEFTADSRIVFHWREPDQSVTVYSEVLSEDFTTCDIEVDSGAGIISFICDDHFCDGGDNRQFGWQRYSKTMQFLNWSKEWELAKHIAGMEIYEK